MLTFIVILMLICASKANHDGRELCEDFSNEWVVHLEGSSEGANILANDLGYENMGEVT